MKSLLSRPFPFGEGPPSTIPPPNNQHKTSDDASADITRVIVCLSPSRHLSQRMICKHNVRTSAQNLHHPPAKPLSFLAAKLHVTQLSPINPIIVISDILAQLSVSGC
jgi:hypothetical protein